MKLFYYKQKNTRLLMFWLLFTFQSRSDTPTTKNKKNAFRWDGLKLGSTWRIIPFSKLLTMASTVSPLDLGKNSPSKWPFHSWLKIHGGGVILTNDPYVSVRPGIPSSYPPGIRVSPVTQRSKTWSRGQDACFFTMILKQKIFTPRTKPNGWIYTYPK